MKKTLIFLFLTLLSWSICSCNSEKDKAIDRLTEMIADTNSQLPMPLDDLHTLAGCTIIEPYLVYEITLDETALIDDFDLVSAFKESHNEMKANLLEGLDIEESAELIDVLKKAGLGIRYHYRGSHSGKSYDINFTPEEIAAM